MPFPLGRADGAARWYRVSIRPLQVSKERGGGKPMAVWQLADITRDRAEQENSFQELQRVINFLDHAPAGFFSCDAEGRIVYLNATLADWLGYDLAQFDAGDLDLSSIVRGDGTELIRSIKELPAPPNERAVSPQLSCALSQFVDLAQADASSSAPPALTR